MKRIGFKVDQHTFDHIRNFLGGEAVHIHDMDEVQKEWDRRAKEDEERKLQAKLNKKKK